jgi:polyribonucleotide nucleotidyltransferase
MNVIRIITTLANESYDMIHGNISKPEEIRKTISIEQADISFVIGKGGSTINMIGNKTGCLVKGYRAKGLNPAKVVIIGPNQRAVENAKQFVFHVANEARTRRIQEHLKLPIPIKKVNPMDKFLPAGALTEGIECIDHATGSIKLVKFNTKTHKYVDKSVTIQPIKKVVHKDIIPQNMVSSFDDDNTDELRQLIENIKITPLIGDWGDN